MLPFGWVMKIHYAAKNGVHTFGYNYAESERIWMNLERCEYTVGGWPWEIRAVATVWEAAEILFVFLSGK